MLKNPLTIIFAFVITQRLPSVEKQIRKELPEQLFDFSLLALLYARLSLHVVYE